MKQVIGTSLLVTIAEDLSNEPLLKVWALDSIDKKTNAPKCLSSLSVQNAKRQFPISAFAAVSDLSQLAVGFANGAVTVVRGDLIHDRGAKQRIVFESEEPITGVEFREVNSTTLFLSTTARLLTLTISGRGQGQPAKALDDHGCDVGCMTIDDGAGEVVVARNDAIYYYRRNGRRQPFAYEGPKQAVRVFGPYIALVARPSSNKHRTGTMRLFGARQTEEAMEHSTFAILDTDLHFVAHTETLSAQIKEVFIEWGSLFLLTLDGQILKYSEKSIEQKLGILYQRNLYIEAINIAQKANLDVAHRNVILRKYGDYLYQKGDYDTAMQQYLKAIDNTEPSQVIRKFLDTQRIHNLIEYLEELHEHDRATVDHTTLLLNCYAKLKDTEKLQNFINSGTSFDFDTAIAMCRQGGYHNQAVFLAQKHGEHEVVVDVLIEDLQKYADALHYIRGLTADLAYTNIVKYARVLLEHCPEETTQVFIDYYTGKYSPKKDDQPIALNPPRSGAASALPSLTSFIPLPYRNSTTASPAIAGQQSIDHENHPTDVTEHQDVGPDYEVPKPRTAFASFVDHPEQFIGFLEACIKPDHIEEGDKTDLYTALFEMYLDKARRGSTSEKTEYENKAHQLIDSKQVPIDASNVLLLSHLSSYKDGTILVREQQGLRSDIFRSYTSARDTAGAIKALRKYGPEEPSLYPAALMYFVSSPKILEEAGTEVDAVLERIERDGLMAPLQVIQTLGATDVATMGVVKKYLHGIIAREKKEIDDNQRIAAAYRNSTAAKRDEMDSLNNKPTVFQARRCALCGASLDLPTVHFLCKHSFHQRCLNTSSASVAKKPAAISEDDFDVDMQCPICEKDNETLRAIRKGQAERAGRHELFLDALSRSRDGMATVSEFFGSGVMSVEPAGT